jgi:hypothetical protein
LGEQYLSSLSVPARRSSLGTGHDRKTSDRPSYLGKAKEQVLAPRTDQTFPEFNMKRLLSTTHMKQRETSSAAKTFSGSQRKTARTKIL